ncbi:heme-binding domain-containing protein [Xanthocytophaga flava]|uniref:heme-binding domain-containing protein n=1 Tax=Xanthocytophaga flava TaxID=3048013 RepID=UPI0028D4ECBC|nr:heme-binding domain-containing protein [Xanthocytophaga flavus]MDJ1467761.1 heme-binding domain-containing protein [Xanthocytophaga flavus]
MKKKILLIFIAILVLIQFIRPERNLGTAESEKDYTHFVQVTPEVAGLLKTACFDCHSNHTEYPWYANINPIGLWLSHHVDEGKRELNFSDFAQYEPKRMDHKLEEIAEEVEEGHMPISSYTLLHKDAKLHETQIKTIVDWVKGERQKIKLP